MKSDIKITEQQSGCGILVYPSGPKAKQREFLKLYSEVLQCSHDRSVSDIGGSFTFTLTGDRPFDEIIQPDDYVRIFMGDSISKSDSIPINAFDFFGNDLSLNAQSKTNLGSKITYESKNRSRKIMFQRAIGKIDRIERVTQTGSENSGTVVTFQVSGRLIGSIVQDITLYYNNWVSGLNAWNAFADVGAGFFGSPSDLIENLLFIVLSGVPMPQFILPEKLVEDLKWTPIFEENRAKVTDYWNKFRDRLKIREELPDVSKSKAIESIEKILADFENHKERTLLQVISFKGFAQTYGRTFSKNFSNSVTTGLYDLLKYLSNDVFNEFYLDFFPQGDPEAEFGSGPDVPTFVLRQRPYDIDSKMLSGSLSGRSQDDLDKFTVTHPRVQIEGVSRTIWDLVPYGVSVFGALQDSDVKSLAEGYINDNERVVQNLLDYAVGYSNHERLNGFLCLGAKQSSQMNADGWRARLSSVDAFRIDGESIKNYGYRMMEVSTIFSSEPTGEGQMSSTIEILKNFSLMLGNWYALNHAFLSGRITTSFVPSARVGVPLKFFQTRKTKDSPYPKMEIFYIQGISESYNFGQPITTSFVVIRGLRYTLPTGKDQAQYRFLNDNPAEFTA